MAAHLNYAKLLSLGPPAAKLRRTAQNCAELRGTAQNWEGDSGTLGTFEGLAAWFTPQSWRFNCGTILHLPSRTHTTRPRIHVQTAGRQGGCSKSAGSHRGYTGGALTKNRVLICAQLRASGHPQNFQNFRRIFQNFLLGNFLLLKVWIRRTPLVSILGGRLRARGRKRGPTCPSLSALAIDAVAIAPGAAGADVLPFRSSGATDERLLWRRQVARQGDARGAQTSAWRADGDDALQDEQSGVTSRPQQACELDGRGARTHSFRNLLASQAVTSLLACVAGWRDRLLHGLFGVGLLHRSAVEPSTRAETSTSPGGREGMFASTSSLISAARHQPPVASFFAHKPKAAPHSLVLHRKVLPDGRQLMKDGSIRRPPTAS